eukprot:6470657-Amphidinium_carterae.1
MKTIVCGKDRERGKAVEVKAMTRAKAKANQLERNQRIRVQERQIPDSSLLLVWETWGPKERLQVQALRRWPEPSHKADCCVLQHWTVVQQQQQGTNNRIQIKTNCLQVFT